MKAPAKLARTITFKTEYAQTLIDDFSQKNKAPHIAISVDMLDTGIDVPEVVNLVFFKLVRSKTKFWQMVGRGTRLCPDLFAPGKDKKFFCIFDYCQNLEFFSQKPEGVEGALGESLAKRLFKARLELIGELDRKPDGSAAPGNGAGLRQEIATLLQSEVAAMNVGNFIVRPKRRLVEQYSKPEAWRELKGEGSAELAHEVAGLPTELEAEDEEAKRFDLLVLNLQLAVLRVEPAFKRLSEQVKAIAGFAPIASPHYIPCAMKKSMSDENGGARGVTVKTAKQVRFASVVAVAGKPEVYLPLFDPKQDRAFMRALKENRVLSVRQEPTSTRADFGTVGFDEKVHYVAHLSETAHRLSRFSNRGHQIRSRGRVARRRKRCAEVVESAQSTAGACPRRPRAAFVAACENNAPEAGTAGLPHGREIRSELNDVRLVADTIPENDEGFERVHVGIIPKVREKHRSSKRGARERAKRMLLHSAAALKRRARKIDVVNFGDRNVVASVARRV